MQCKKLKGQLVFGVALGAVMMAPLVAHAAGTTTDTTTTVTTDTTTTMTDTGSMGMTMSSEPMQVSGQVLRYYTDASGYVTAMDVQTAEGVRMVRFGPTMGQRFYTTYPVGSTIGAPVGDRPPTYVYAMGSPLSGRSGMARYDVVSVGTTAPSRDLMIMPYALDADVLDSVPNIAIGAKMTTVRGRLRNIITNNRGEVVGIVLASQNFQNMYHNMASGSTNANMVGAGMTSDTTATTATGTDTTATATGTETTTTTTTTTVTTETMNATNMMNLQAMGDILIRVPRELRHIAPGYSGTERVTPLFKNSDVIATGYPEAPRYGVVSVYNQRIVADAITVNGRAAGALGFPLMDKNKRAGALFGWNFGGTGSPEEQQAASMGYTPYNPGMMGDSTMMTPGTMDPGMAGSGMGAGTGTGTTGTGTGIR